MDSKKLEFWGKSSLVEMTSKELKIYLGWDQIVLPLIFTQSRVPTKVIPLSRIRRINLRNDIRVEITWDEADESGVIYRTMQIEIELHKNDANRLYHALLDIMKGVSFNRIVERYSPEAKPKNVIRDEEVVIIFNDHHKIASIIEPEIYENFYEEKGKRLLMLKRGGIFVPKPKTYLPPHIKQSIPYSEVQKVEPPVKRNGKYVVNVSLINGETIKVKFNDIGNAINFHQMLNSRASKVERRGIQLKPTTGKTLAVGGVLFIASYWLLTSIIRLPSRTASIYALMICLLGIATSWLLKRKSEGFATSGYK
ncbi:MAG: hypothetical protein NDF55_01715 [archaeon GB-1867-005]|nr:hypothetical protein [Candidatus Culexmicrobium cathedralense]